MSEHSEPSSSPCWSKLNEALRSLFQGGKLYLFCAMERSLNPRRKSVKSFNFSIAENNPSNKCKEDHHWIKKKYWIYENDILELWDEKWNVKAIIAFSEAIFSVSERLNRCSAVPVELTSHWEVFIVISLNVVINRDLSFSCFCYFCRWQQQWLKSNLVDE